MGGLESICTTFSAKSIRAVTNHIHQDTHEGFHRQGKVYCTFTKCIVCKSSMKSSCTVWNIQILHRPTRETSQLFDHTYLVNAHNFLAKKNKWFLYQIKKLVKLKQIPTLRNCCKLQNPDWSHCTDWWMADDIFTEQRLRPSSQVHSRFYEEGY